MKYLVLVIGLICLNVEACYKPKNGFGMNKDTLINSAKEIVIVELINVAKQGVGFEYTFKTISIIKGVSEHKIKFYSNFPPVTKTEDFNGHTDNRFWKTDVGRSWFPQGACGPVHYFSFGEQYLLFPGLFGASASGENVSSKYDRWLSYVKKSL